MIKSMKKIILLIVLLLVFSLSGCIDKNDIEQTEKSYEINHI